METLDKLLDRLADKAGSDRKIGPMLGASHAAVSAWRTRRAFPDDEKCRRMAELLKLDNAYVLAIVHGERAKSAEVKAAWRRIAQAFATVLLTVGAVAAPSPAEARFDINSGGARPGAGLDTHCRLKRRRKPTAGSPGSRLAHAALQALGLSRPERLGAL